MNLLTEVYISDQQRRVMEMDTNEYQYIEALAKLISSVSEIAYPIIVAGLLFYFRRQIKKFLNRITRLEFAGLNIESKIEKQTQLASEKEKEQVNLASHQNSQKIVSYDKFRVSADELLRSNYFQEFKYQHNPKIVLSRNKHPIIIDSLYFLPHIAFFVHYGGSVDFKTIDRSANALLSATIWGQTISKKGIQKVFGILVINIDAVFQRDIGGDVFILRYNEKDGCFVNKDDLEKWLNPKIAGDIISQ